MTDRLKELRDQQAKLVVDARAKLEEITDDIDESRAKEIESQYDKMMGDYDKLDARAKREEELVKRQEATEKHAAELESVDTSRRPKGDERHVNGAGAEDAEKASKKSTEAERKAFQNYLRYGMDGLNPEERSILSSRKNDLRALMGEAEARAQGVASTGAGAALVPEGFMAELITSLKAFGPMNDDGIVRRIQTATGNAIPWPTLDDTSNKGSLLSENTQVNTQDVTFGTKTLNAYKYSSDLILVSNELLQDSAIDVEGIVRMALAERIGRILNEHFTTADGSSKPNGIVSASTLGVTAAAQSTITADELIDLEHSVDPAYRSDPSARFMFNDTTFKLIRKLKDGQGNYLWQPADLRIASPSTLLGYPYSINQDIATGESGESPATQEKSVIFGAMNRYVVRMVLMFAVRRLTERYADYDQVGFVGFTRADGELLDAAAVKHLRMASA